MCERRESDKTSFFSGLSSPHHRGMDTKSLSSIIQSKQRVSEKLLYKNTVHDTCVECWVLMLYVLHNFLHGAWFCEGLSNIHGRGQLQIPHRTIYLVEYNNRSLLVVPEIHHSMNPCNFHIIKKALIEGVTHMGQSSRECKQFTSLAVRCQYTTATSHSRSSQNFSGGYDNPR